KIPPTFRSALDEYADIDVNADDVMKVVQSNQYFEAAIMHYIKGLGLQNQNLTLRNSISMIGMQGFRDLICGLQMHRLVTHEHLEIPKEFKNETNEGEETTKSSVPKNSEKKDGLDPKSYLKYAMRA